MAMHIVRLNDPATCHEYFLLWSTVADAPTTYGMDGSELQDFYRKHYGESGMREFWELFERVLQKGTDAIGDDSAEETMAGNRAGKDESTLTPRQILESYCIRRDKEPPMGTFDEED